MARPVVRHVRPIMMHQLMYVSVQVRRSDYS